MLFSVITPCYNVEKYIRECIESVRAQSFHDWEMICVDDGSPDKTGTILDEYATLDSRIKVIHQPNAGLSAARNAALSLATGEWLYYLDSDDVMPPEMLSRVSKDIKVAADADIVWGNLTAFMDGSKPEWKNGEDLSIKTVDVDDMVYFRHFSTYFPTFLFRRNVFGDILFVGVSWCEERPYVAKCMARAKKIIEVGYSTYGFRKRNGSITHSKMKLEHCTGYLDATRDVLKILTASGKKIEPALMRMLLTNWMEWTPRHIVTLLDARDRSTAWKYWFNSLQEISKYKAISIWRQFTVSVCRHIHFPLLAVMLCFVPDWLKRQGLHR